MEAVKYFKLFAPMLNAKQIIGLAGGLLLLLGIFLPVIKIPFIGNSTYMQNQEIESYIIIALAVLTILLLWLKKYKGLWFTGIVSLGILVYSYIRFQNLVNGNNTKIENDLGVFYKELSGMFQDAIQLQWGVTILLTGAVLIILSAALKKPA